MQVNSERLALIVRIASGHLAEFFFFFFPEGGPGDENPIKLQELKNKEHVLFFFPPFKTMWEACLKDLEKQNKPTTGSCIM